MSVYSDIFNALAGDLKFYWICATFGSIVFIVQFIMFLCGGFGIGDIHPDSAGMDGTDSHLDSGFGDFKLISARSVMAFVTFFGWGGVIFGKHGGLGGFFAALICGFVMMLLTALTVYMVFKLQQSGNIMPDDYINCRGNVYFGIPGNKSGTGKVSVTVKGCQRQVDAMAEEEIPTGTPIVIVSKIDSQRFLVKKV